MAQTQINYKPTFFDMLKHLSQVHIDVIIEKTDAGNVLVQKRNEIGSIAYTLEVEPTIFNFDVDENKMAFQNFPEVFQLMKLVGSTATMSTNSDATMLKIVDGKTKIDVNLGSTDAITSGFGGKRIPFDNDNSHKIAYSHSMTTRILKVLGTLPSADSDRRLTFTIDGANLVVDFWSVAHNTKVTEEFEGVVTTNGDASETEFILNSEVFKLLPNMGDESFENSLYINDKGIFKFNFKSKESSEFNLDMITAKIKK